MPSRHKQWIADMYQIIQKTLYRQRQALKVLDSLLQEEYDLLRQRDTNGVVSLEFSIHELIRQIAVEKTWVMGLLQGGKVRDYAALLPEEQGKVLLDLYNEIDEGEQKCSRQASNNAQFSLALLDQSQRTMNELHKKMTPHNAITYGRRGYMSEQQPQATIISGRL